MTNILLVIYSIFELSGLGGWSTENVSPKSSEPSLSLREHGSYTYGAHVGYVLQFHPNVGIGIGADFQRYGTSTRMVGDAYWMSVYDTEGQLYNHRLHVYSLRDDIQQLYVNVPLSLRFFVPMDNVSLEFQVGAKFGLPVSSTGKYKGDVEHMGQYPQWGDLELNQVPNHGFYRDQTIADNYSLSKPIQAFAFAKVGLLVPLTDRLQLTVHVGADYGLLNSKPETDNAQFGANNNGDQAHYFMPAYSGILSTPMTSGKMHPMSVTGEIGLRFVINHRKSYPCMCYTEQPKKKKTIKSNYR